MRGSKFAQPDDATWGEDALLLRVRTATDESKEGWVSVQPSHVTDVAHGLRYQWWSGVVLIAFLSRAVHQPYQFVKLAVRMLSIAPLLMFTRILKGYDCTRALITVSSWEIKKKDVSYCHVFKAVDVALVFVSRWKCQIWIFSIP